MKKSVLLLFLSFFSWLNHAQVWVDEGATWHMDFWNIALEGFYEYEYTGDTLIDGHNCQIIDGQRYAYGMISPDEFGLLWTSSMGTHYTYVSGDTVFYQRGDEFFVLLNFNVEPGDSWIISNEAAGFETCNDTSYIEVLDTGSVMIGGESYRTISLTPRSDASRGFSGVFVERFGIMGGLPAELDAMYNSAYLDLFPHDFLCEAAEDEVIVEWDYTTFKCFEDNSFDLYNPSGEDCDWWRVNLGVEEAGTNPISLYPNPASNVVQVNGLTQETDYLLFDLNAKVAHKGITSGEIKVDHLVTGIYLLKIGKNHFKLIKE